MPARRVFSAGAAILFTIAAGARCTSGDGDRTSDAGGPSSTPATTFDGASAPESGPVLASGSDRPDAAMGADGASSAVPAFDADDTDGIAVTPPPVTDGGTLASLSDGSAPGRLSGLPWTSGVESNFTSEQTVWGAFRGRPTDVAHVYAGRDSWSSLTQPGYVFSNMSGYPGRIVLSVSPYPESLGQSAMATCAGGSYDSNWKTFGSTLVSNGRRDTIVRLGWEFNGNWFGWSCTVPADYKACFRHVVQAIRATDPQATFDWTMNAHYSQNPPSHDAYDCYPGDDLVDIVGIDSYDMYPPSPDESSWDSQCSGTQGLCTLIAFARSHGKKFSVGEWGVVSGSGSNGGHDNPFYVQKMHDTFAANAGAMAYEAYFNNSDSGNVDSSIHSPDDNPNASAKYHALFGK